MWQETEVESWVLSIRLRVEHFVGLSAAKDEFDLEVQDLSLLFFSEGSELFVTLEESVTGLKDSTLIDAPGLAELSHDVLLFVHLVDGLLVSNVVESDDTIGNSLSFDQLDPANFSSTVAMGTTASFGINTFNVNNSERVSWNHTTLI